MEAKLHDLTTLHAQTVSLCKRWQHFFDSVSRSPLLLPQPPSPSSSPSYPLGPPDDEHLSPTGDLSTPTGRRHEIRREPGHLQSERGGTGSSGGMTAVPSHSKGEASYNQEGPDTDEVYPIRAFEEPSLSDSATWPIRVGQSLHPQPHHYEQPTESVINRLQAAFEERLRKRRVGPIHSIGIAKASRVPHQTALVAGTKSVPPFPPFPLAPPRSARHDLTADLREEYLNSTDQDILSSHSVMYLNEMDPPDF